MKVLRIVNQIIDIETQKWEKRGKVGTLIALLLLFGIFEGCRRIGEAWWPQTIQDEGSFAVFGGIVIHVLAQISIFSIFLPGYLNLLPFYDKYMINQKSSWPWERASWKQLLPKCVYNLILNQFFIYPYIGYASTLMGINLRFHNFPSLFQIFWQFLFVFTVEDFLYFWIHWYTHQNKTLYKYHKIHHEYDKVFTVVFEYFHPVDFIITLIPSSIAFIILGDRVHCFMLFFYIFWKVMMSSEGHSGYELPWSPFRVLPFFSGPSFHDHHHSHNSGNYSGTLYIFDLLFGTSQTYFKQYLAVKKE